MATYDEMLEGLTARRAALLSEVERIDRILKTLREAQALLSSPNVRFDHSPDYSNVEIRDDNQPEKPVGPHQGVLAPDQIVKFAREVLIERGRPLKRGALVRAMEEKGLPLHGADKAKNLGTILWRAQGMFINVPKRGYWPADVPLPGDAK